MLGRRPGVRLLAQTGSSELKDQVPYFAVTARALFPAAEEEAPALLSFHTLT